MNDLIDALDLVVALELPIDSVCDLARQMAGVPPEEEHPNPLLD
jgi:hypothetical protein